MNQRYEEDVKHAVKHVEINEPATSNPEQTRCASLWCVGVGITV